MQLTHRPIPLCCVPTLRQPPSWPLPAALMPRSLHPFVHSSCKFFFLIVLPLLTLASLSLRAASALSCHVRSLMPRLFSCHVRSPMLLLHPHPCCINPPFPGLSRLHRCPNLCALCQMPRSSSTPLHCMLCSACVMPPPPPTPLPCLMHASVSVSVRLYTCYFTCIRIRL